MMKDIVLKGTSIKKELRILLIMLIIAFGVNIYAIVAYETPWIELITAFGFVAILALLFYIGFGLVRLLIIGIRKALRL